MLIGKQKRTNTAATCRICGHLLSGATGVGHDEAPKPNDISICIKCGNIAAFDEELQTRPLTADEWKVINAQDEVMHMQKMIRMVNDYLGRV